MSIVKTCLIVAVLLATAACASNPPLYRPGSSTLASEPVVDFSRYLATVQAHVETNLVPVEGFARAQQVQWNLPFRRLPAGACPAGDRTGLLLVHGLSDSPFVFRDLADYLADHCVEVRTLLLQGHGTRPGDLVTARAEVWQAQVREHFRALSRDVDRAFIGGFSLGGALATEYALSGESPQPAGLVAVAPAWQLNGLRDYLWLAPIADVFGDFVEKEPELNPVKYESFSFNAGTQIGKVISAAQRRIVGQDRIELPLFLAATEADSVINLEYLVAQFRQRFTHPGNTMMVFRDTRTPWPETAADPRIRSLNSYLPDANILEFSHQSLLIAPDNELYGLGGPLQRCLEPNNLSLEDCRQLPQTELWFSAWHDTERPVLTSRLTYNPSFDDLAQAIRGFLAANGAVSGS